MINDGRELRRNSDFGVAPGHGRRAKTVTVEDRDFPVRRTSRSRLREVDFQFQGHASEAPTGTTFEIQLTPELAPEIKLCFHMGSGFYSLCRLGGVSTRSKRPGSPADARNRGSGTSLTTVGRNSAARTSMKYSSTALRPLAATIDGRRSRTGLAEHTLQAGTSCD
jgi:hypothetical protein